MKYGTLSRLMSDKISIFSTFFPDDTVPIFKGKKKEHVQEILYALAHLGPSKTSDIANFVLPKTPKFKNNLITSSDRKKRSSIYNKLIQGRQEKNKGTSRKIKKYPGLISNRYVIQTGTIKNEKGNDIPLYFLTLKGCFVALGFENLDIQKFIKHSSLNHLYFMFLNILMEKTSLSFVKYMFTNPIRDDIKKGRISFKNEEISFYFTMIVEAIANVFQPTTRSVFYQYFMNNPDGLSPKLYPILREIEILMDNNYYYEKPKEDWTDSIIEKYYPKSKDEDFYREYSDGNYGMYDEQTLLSRLMMQFQFSYFTCAEYASGPVSRIPRYRLSRSKAWRRHRKYVKSN